METRSVARFARIGPRKVRLVADLIRGKDVEEALEILRLSRTRGGRMLEKVLHAAVAAAVEQHDVDPEDLYVSRTWVDGGPMRSWRLPRARGMWTPIHHRTSHINVVVCDERDEAGDEGNGGA